MIPPPHQPRVRRLPDEPLPPYRYVPGQGPHPLRHPEGHSRDPVPLNIEHHWIRGLDLFDHRYYWESHEVWEAAWKALPEGPRRQMLQGLIQLAAATLKHHLGHARPASLLLGRADARLTAVIEARGAVWWGVDLSATLAGVRAFVQDGGNWPVIETTAPPI